MAHKKKREREIAKNLCYDVRVGKKQTKQKKNSQPDNDDDNRVVSIKDLTLCKEKERLKKKNECREREKKKKRTKSNPRQIELYAVDD